MKRSLLIVAAIAFAANFTYLHFSNGDFFYPDSFTYLTPARSLANSRGFVDARGAAETIRTPVYPLLLIALRFNTLAILVLQHLLNVALACTATWLVRRRGGSSWLATLAGILCALDVPSIHYANKVLTETLFAALLFAIVVLTLRATSRRALLVDGLLVGTLVLIRPVAIAYLVVIAIFLAFQRVPLRTIAIFVIAALALPLAWAARNKHHTGVFTVSSIAGSNLMMYRAAGALAVTTDYDFNEALADAQQELLERADQLIGDRDLPHAQRAVIFSTIGRQTLVAHPGGALLVTLRGLLVNAFDSDWEAVMLVSRIHGSIIQLLIDALTAITFAAAVLGIIALWRNDRSLALLLALTIAYFLFIAAGGEAEARFRVPVAPLLAIAAAHGFSERGRPRPLVGERPALRA